MTKQMGEQISSDFIVSSFPHGIYKILLLCRVVSKIPKNEKLESGEILWIDNVKLGKYHPERLSGWTPMEC